MNRTIDNLFYMDLCHNMKMQKNVCLYICFITTLMHLYVNDLCFDWLTLCQVKRGTLSFQKILHYFPLYGFFKIKTTSIWCCPFVFKYSSKPDGHCYLHQYSTYVHICSCGVIWACVCVLRDWQRNTRRHWHCYENSRRWFLTMSWFSGRDVNSWLATVGRPREDWTYYSHGAHTCILSSLI